jgi:hypothetical protein
MKSSITLLLGILILTGCTRRGQITVVNESQATLTNVVAVGSGFSSPIDPIAPNSKKTITISPRPDGQAGLKLDFDADGKHFTSDRSANVWDGMKEVILTVEPAFSIKEEAVTSF